jgi:hypothetical protein
MLCQILWQFMAIATMRSVLSISGRVVPSSGVSPLGSSSASRRLEAWLRPLARVLRIKAHP